MSAEKLRQQKALAAAANAGNNLDEAIVLSGNQLAKVQISFYRHAGIISHPCDHVNVAMLKLVRYMTYFKHLGTKAWSPTAREKTICSYSKLGEGKSKPP